MTKFQETIVALTGIRNSIDAATRCLYSVDGSNLAERVDRFKDSTLRFTLQNYIQILLNSFLEEWQRFAAFSKSDTGVKVVLKNVSPATARFKQWPGLWKIRSSLLAHSPRDKNGSLIFPWQAFNNNKCPTTLEETLLLAFCAILSVDNARKIYVEQQAEAEKEILKENRVILKQGISSTSDLENEFYTIQKQIEQNKKSSTDVL